MWKARVNIKRWSFAVIRSFLLLCLLWLLLARLTENFTVAVDFQDFFYKGLLSLQELHSTDVSFIKLLICISIFIIGFFDTIIRCSDLTENSNRLLKYYSIDIRQYIINRLRISFYPFLLDSFTWSIGVIGFVVWFPSIEIGSVLLYVCLVTGFINIASLFSPNSLYLFLVIMLLFIGQHVLYQHFLLSIAIGGIGALLSCTGIGSRLRGDET